MIEDCRNHKENYFKWIYDLGFGKRCFDDEINYLKVADLDSLQFYINVIQQNLDQGQLKQYMESSIELTKNGSKCECKSTESPNEESCSRICDPHFDARKCSTTKVAFDERLLGAYSLSAFLFITAVILVAMAISIWAPTFRIALLSPLLAKISKGSTYQLYAGIFIFMLNIGVCAFGANIAGIRTSAGSVIYICSCIGLYTLGMTIFTKIPSFTKDFKDDFRDDFTKDFTKSDRHHHHHHHHHHREHMAKAYAIIGKLARIRKSLKNSEEGISSSKASSMSSQRSFCSSLPCSKHASQRI